MIELGQYMQPQFHFFFSVLQIDITTHLHQKPFQHQEKQLVSVYVLCLSSYAFISMNDIEKSPQIVCWLQNQFGPD